MGVGMIGESAVKPVELELRQELVQILHQQMEVLSVLDLQDRLVTDKHAL